MNIKNRQIMIVGFIALIVVGAVIYFVVKNNKNTNSQIEVSAKPANINEFSDGTLGINFYITKDFQRIDDSIVKKFNPNFIYGFKPKDVDNVNCYVSQTKRTSAGDVSQEYLKNGTMEAIKGIFPDAELMQSENITIGDVKGVKLIIIYKDNDKDIKQIEYVGTNDLLTTFAFCNCPESLSEFYFPKFEQFLNSIKITK